MRHAKRSAVALLLSFAVLSGAASQLNCSPNKLREARKAAHRIQVVTDASIDTTATLFHDGVFGDPASAPAKARTNQIARVLLKVNSSNKILIDKAEAATADTSGVRADLIAQLKVVESAIKELKALGLIGIKSKDGSLAFDSAVSALDASLAVIQAALAGR